MISLHLAPVRESPRAAPGPSHSACCRKLDCIFRLRPVMMLSSTRHALEQRDVLEGARDAALGGVVAGPCRGAAAPRNAIVALLRTVHAVDHVEHRALAGAVGADDGADLVLAHVEGNVGQRLHAAEGERDAVRGRRITSPTRRCGRCSCGSPSRSRASRSPSVAADRWRHAAFPSAAARSSHRRSRGRPRPCRCGRPRTSPASRCTATSRPLYSASISTAYFSAMKPRRTLRVRVSSSSSGSSSLCRIRKRWICESARSPRAARSALTFSTHSRDQRRTTSGLRGEVGVAGIGEAAPLGPVADRVHVDVDERADAVAVVAEGDRLLDDGEELELVLDVVRREHRAVGELAHVLGAVDDLQVAVVVEEAGVAGVEVAVGVDRLRRSPRAACSTPSAHRRRAPALRRRRRSCTSTPGAGRPTVSNFIWPSGCRQT